MWEPDRLHFVIEDYFKAAFGIPLLRYVSSEEDYSPSLRHAHFNRLVLPEIIQRMNEWNTATLEGSWVDGLAIHPLQEHVNQLESAHFDEFTRVWGDLNDQEKRCIVRKNARLNHDWEVLKVLAAITERLQQQVVELEEELERKRSSHSARNAAEPSARKQSGKPRQKSRSPQQNGL